MLNSSDAQPYPIENEFIEYKEVFNEKCKKEIAAFLNGNQIAYIYLGVSDSTRKVVRIFTEQEKHAIEEQIGRWISSSIYYPSPVGLVHVRSNQELFCIEVTPGKFMPYFLDGKVYVKFNEIKNIFQREGLSFRSKALGFFNSDEKFTNTAFLMSDQSDFSVKIAIFDGVTVDQFKDRREFVGCLPKQVDEILTYIDLNNPLSAHISGQATRKEQRSYPSVAVREAIINAIVHRSYFSQAPIQIEIFDNRLTIMSPGPLPGGMKLKAVLAGQTLPRNPQVVKIMNRLKYIANCKCKLASAGEDSWRKGFSEFQLKKAKQYEPCEHA
ncbi:MAG: putative DNA binding domain-containing protein [Lactobacillaceae bacterium]|nr:putative DNA binding domain-containing protein [Lactobacillaceae bacterium]